MKKIDPTVLKETKYIALWVVILSAVMQAVFLVIGKWDITVLSGNVLGALAAVGNFLLMGITVQNALDKDKDDAKTLIKLSQTLRMFMLFGIALVGYLVPGFNIIAVVLPYVFPRIAITIRGFLIKE